jgi:dTDP-4-amino-4,6-dideoxygalactose transaminase
LNFKMSELTGAIVLAQMDRLTFILETLRTNKGLLREALAGASTFSEARLTDRDGDVGTYLPVVFSRRRNAEAFCDAAGTRPLVTSGWHVATNMPRRPGVRVANVSESLDILRRTVVFGIGVRDHSLTQLGLDIRSDTQEVLQLGRKIMTALGRP